MRATVLTDRGKVREQNEDAVVIGPATIHGLSMRAPMVCELALTEPVLVAVADGMGGHAAGDVASAHTVRALATCPPTDPDGLLDALRRADDELLAMSAEDPLVFGLGTTVAGVLCTADGGVFFNVGDSRVYVEHGGYLTQVSTDDRGVTGGLTQCLGGRSYGAPLQVTLEELPAADRVLLCSDGLSDLVSREDMEELLAKAETPCHAVTSLWAAAMDASGRDNITIVLLTCDSAGHPADPSR
jgi:PPM family protein phosphatase